MKIVKDNIPYKVNLKDKTVLVYDDGSFIELAIRLIGHFKKVLYYCPYKEEYIQSSKYRIGTGIPGLTRVEEFFEIINEVDLFIFPGINEGDLQEHLISLGKRVFGSRHGDDIEINRVDTHKYFKKKGFDSNELKEIVGLDNLLRYLKDKEDLFIKMGKFRGTFQTKQFINFDLHANYFKDLAVELGNEAPYMKFIVETPIKDCIEIGYDGFCIDGKFPNKSIFGYEIKDAGYACTVKDYKDLPQQMLDTNEALAPILAEAQYKNYLSYENRLNKKENYVLDICARRGIPPGELMDEMILNTPEVLWFGSEGIIINPIIEAKFGIEIMTYSPFATKNWVTVEFPEKLRNHYKFKNLTKIEGKYCVIPSESKGTAIGAVVAWGNTLEGAIEKVKEYITELKGEEIEAKIGSISDIWNTIAEGEKMGIKF
jgi:hypothetical protein